MKVRIVIDSTADVRESLRSRLTVVPLTIHFGENVYTDGVDITHQEFYEKLVETDVMPRTSQAPPAAFLPHFKQAVTDGDSLVVITVASALSGTYQSAVLAAREAGGEIYVVDSETVAIGAGILAEYALRLADEGLCAQEIALRLEIEKKNVHVIALLDTLEYLKRGGRISSAVAFAGQMLSIKPVVSIQEGEIRVLGKARGSRQGNNLLIREISACGGIDFDKPLLVGYTGLSDALLEKYIEDSSALWDGQSNRPEGCCIGSVVGTHAGPGAVAVAFFHRRKG